MKRLINALGIATTVTFLSIGVASAASLGFSSSRLSAGSASVTGCTSSPLAATRDVDNSGVVMRVDVLNVPQACAGETLDVTLESSGGSSLGSSTAPVGACAGGCTVSVTGFVNVPAANVGAYALSLTQ